MEQVQVEDYADPRDISGHATPGDSVWITRPKDDDSNPTSRIPVSTVFATGNGGEFRKSFHSYPAPYAQLIESPSSWSIQPMQIDTKNRDGSMAEPGMPFKPGPYPTSAQAPRTGPDAVYSGLLECELPLSSPSPSPSFRFLSAFWRVCTNPYSLGPLFSGPCTDRITKSMGAAGAATALVTGECTHAVASASECESAAAELAQSVKTAAKPGSCGYAEHSGTFLGGFAPGAPEGGWKALAPAQAWCCAHSGCGGVTYQSGAYTARAGRSPTPFKLQGLSSWLRGGATTPFNFTSGASASQPPGCSLSVTPAGVRGFFNTEHSAAPCGGQPGTRKVSGDGDAGSVSLSVAMDEAANKVTITITGPDTVWFGVGFNADAMAAMPWTIVVDGHGTVSSLLLYISQC